MNLTKSRYKDLILNTQGEFFTSSSELPYGGKYIPEVLLPGLQEIAEAFDHFKFDAIFLADLTDTLHTFSGRPTAFTPLPRLSAEIDGAQIYLKNEGLNHTGAHKITH